MILKLLFVLFFLSSCSSRVEDKNWREEVRRKHGSRYRISFGESSLHGDQGEAIKRARTTALAEMAKTFFVKVSSSSDVSLNYEKSSGRESISENLFSQVFEESRKIELAGIDLASVDIDQTRGLVTVAAIMDLQKFETHLKNRILQLVEGVQTRKDDRRCSGRLDLKRIREVLNNLSSAGDIELILMSFTPAQPIFQKDFEEYLSFGRNCRSKFTFTTNSQKILASGVIKQNLENEGFRFSPRFEGSKAIKIDILEKNFPSEFKFERINLLGKIEISLSHEGESFNWITPTIRQIDTSQESAQIKLNVRLGDELEKGINTLIKENF